MNNTIEYYDQNTAAFIAATIHADMSDHYDRFLKYVKEGGSILDAGCGSGRDALVFKEKGYKVDAFDASEEMCRQASELIGIPVICKRFEELSGESEYDGIWACASLLHVQEDNLEEVMRRLHDLLKRGGVLYASFKEGSTGRIKEGRYFHDMTIESCRTLFERMQFEVLELYKTQDVRDGHEGEMWVNVIGKSL